MKHDLSILILEDFLTTQKKHLVGVKEEAAKPSANPKIALLKLRAIQNLEGGIKEVTESIACLKRDE